MSVRLDGCELVTDAGRVVHGSYMMGRVDVWRRSRWQSLIVGGTVIQVQSRRALFIFLYFRPGPGLYLVSSYVLNLGEKTLAT